MTENRKICDASNMVWIDCEMTGLDAQTDVLLEIAVIVTNKDLNILAEGPNLVIHQSNEVCTLSRCLKITEKVSFLKLQYVSLRFWNQCMNGVLNNMACPD